jgi:hypothetical protein
MTVKIGTPKLTVNVNPAGNGTVKANGVTLIGYPNTTNRSWDEVVNLNATTTVLNWTFDHWSGALNGSANPINITMDGNKNVTAHFAAVVVGATLEGHVSFSGRTNNTQWIEPFVVKGFEHNNLSHVLWTGNATTNNTGVFNITGLNPGTYDIGIKNWTCVSEVVSNVTLTAGNTTVVNFGTTREGDIDNNDWVYLGDLSAFCTAWNTKPGDGLWNVNADFDRNGWVYLGDLSLFCTNWNQKGDAWGHFV